MKRTNRSPNRLDRTSWIPWLAGLLLSVPLAAQTDSFDNRLVAAVEAAHGATAWRAQPAIEAQMTIEFGGREAFAGTVLFEPSMAKVRLELADGTVAVYDGQDAWTAPADSAFQGARFHLLTWPYFMAAPMKLGDPGTHLEDLGKRVLDDDRSFPAARLTFGDGVGDSPDDWYVVYYDEKSARLEAMAYIVTFDKDKAEAEKEPHAITYEDYAALDGVQIARLWQFWNWNAEEGIVGEPLGKATLHQVRFVEPPSGAFDKPTGARPEPLPGS